MPLFINHNKLHIYNLLFLKTLFNLLRVPFCLLFFFHNRIGVPLHTTRLHFLYKCLSVSLAPYPFFVRYMVFPLYSSTDRSLHQNRILPRFPYLPKFPVRIHAYGILLCFPKLFDFLPSVSLLFILITKSSFCIPYSILTESSLQ